MKKILYIIASILLTFNVALAGQITIGKKKGNYNDFSADTNCVAVWRLESGALTADSKGSNTLTDNNTVGTDTTNFMQGAASGDFEEDNSEFLSIADASLDAGFPLKNGDTSKTFSICAWIRIESVPGTNFIHIASKFGENQRSMTFRVGTDAKLQLSLGFNSGASEELLNHASALSTDTWYHVTATYQNSDKAWFLRVRDAGGSTVGSDATGTAELDASKVSIFADPFLIGSVYWGSYIQYWDGQIDEVVVFKTVLTETQSTNISKGIFR